jgi:alpha-tubulin suppressor-like RCC1 family protein
LETSLLPDDYTQFAAKTDDSMYVWGDNGSYRLGLGIPAIIDISSPTQIGALTVWNSSSAGNNACAAIRTNGTLWTWGGNGAGQLGINNTLDKSSPVQVGGLSNWATALANKGATNTAAIKTDGTLWSWGINDDGQLGLGDTADRSSPVQIGSLTTWTEVSFGNDASMGINQSTT